MNAMQNQARTTPASKEPTLEELEQLTKPGTDTALAQVAAQAAAKMAEGQLTAFELPKESFKTGETFQVGPEVPIDRVTELRLELMPMLLALQDQVQKLRAVLPQAGDDTMLATMRGMIYCPQCGAQLDGGANTSQVNTPYVHPMGSAAPKECTLSGRKFEKPKVFLKLLPVAVKKTA